MSGFTDNNPHLRPSFLFTENTVLVKKLLNGASESLNVNGSIAPVTFSAVPDVGTYWMITRMLLYYSDATAFSEELFAGITALTNGVSVLCNNTEIVNWKDNIDVNLCMYDTVDRSIFAKAGKSLAGWWTFSKLGSKFGLKVDDTTNGFAIKIQDNLTGLTEFKVQIQGLLVTP